MRGRLLPRARRALAGAGAFTLLLAGARADVPAEFPARFETHLTDRIVITGRVGGQSVARRDTIEADRTIVFDDASHLHFEGASLPYPVSATWRRASRRIATFRLTPETIDAYRAYAAELTGVEGPMRVAAGVARLRFSADGATFRGTQRSTVRMRVRGVSVTLVENALYQGTAAGG